MAATVQVAGACLVQTNTGEDNVFEDLGYSINGVEITEECLVFNVPGDQNGGDDGLPVEIQEMGEHHFIRMDMSVWDAAVAEKTAFAKYKGNTAGVEPTPGTLMFGTGGFFSLKLNSPNFKRTYTKAFPVTRPVETNAGTKYQHLIIEWEAQPPIAGGTLYTTP